jgi:hypothetical protein
MKIPAATLYQDQGTFKKHSIVRIDVDQARNNKTPCYSPIAVHPIGHNLVKHALNAVHPDGHM